MMKLIIRYEKTEERECNCQGKEGEIVWRCNGILSLSGEEEK
jgi:hypothetical protein